MSHKKKSTKGAFDNKLFEQILEVANVNVMMADNNLDIIYINPALMRTLEAREREMREKFPNFSAANLVGRNIDDFHNNPSHQRKILHTLDRRYETQIQVGKVTFGLIVHPIIDENGVRQGHVVEWSDKTLAIAAEKLAKDATCARAGLDNVTTNFMIADPDLNIIYLNKTLEEMLRRNESAIQKDLPTFRATGLIGRNIDDFHKNPQHQRSILKNLTTNVKTQLKLGGRTFNLLVIPIYNEEGVRLGTGVEWADISEKLVDEQKKQESQQLIEEQIDLLTKMLDQLQSSCELLSTSCSQQAVAIEQVSTSLDQTDSQIRQNAQNANSVSHLANEASVLVREGHSKMERMLASMNSILNVSQNIAKMNKGIDEIAFQTNILALNAAVEAARAGQHGKGFAVVAQEVRNLAARSAKAAKETAELIEDTNKKVNEGVEIAKETANSLNNILQNAVKVEELISDIAKATNEQSKGIEQVNLSISQVNEGVNNVNRQSNELASFSVELTEMTEKLNHEMNRSKIADGMEKNLSNMQLPPGITAEMIQYILNTFGQKTKESIVHKHHNHSDEISKYSSISKEKKKRRRKEADPSNFLSLDEDERGFGEF